MPDLPLRSILLSAMAVAGLACAPVAATPVTPAAAPTDRGPSTASVAATPESPSPPRAWATTVGPVGAQFVDAMVVDPQGNTHSLTSVHADCEASTSTNCGPAGPRQQLWVTHDRRGEVVAQRWLDPAEGRIVTLAPAQGGSIAMLRSAPPFADGRPPPWGPSEVLLLDPSTGTRTGTVPLDLNASPGVERIVATGSGDFVVAGVFDGALRLGTHTITSSSEEWDVFVARFDASGQLKWHVTARGHTPGLSGQDTLGDLALLSNGDAVITGGCRGRPLRFEATTGSTSIRCGGRRRDDAFVARIDPKGGLRWVRHLESARSKSKWSIIGAIPVALAEAPDRGVVLLGLFSHEVQLHAGPSTQTLFGRGFADTFVAHYDAEGTLVRTWQVGGRGQDRLTDVLVKGDTVWATGSVSGFSALDDLTPSTSAAAPDPDDLRLPELGVLLRIGLSDDRVDHLLLHTEPESNVTSSNPKHLQETDDGLRIGGDFAAEAAKFPGEGRATKTLLRRLSPRENYESFLWAPTWDMLRSERLQPTWR